MTTSQRILITGAARGIGAETARRLAARGHTLALLGLEPDLLEEVAAGAFWREVDVTDRAALEEAVADAAAELGGLDAVIANAGIGSGGLFETFDPDEWERVIAINLVGVARTLRAALPHVAASRGYLLPVASSAAILHAPGMSAYCAAKAGVEAMADCLRAEVAHRGVDVGVAYFHWIDTEMVRGGDDRAAFRHMRSKLRGPLGKTLPVAAAADAVVRGVESRARIVAAPGWVRWLLPVRGLIQRPADRETSKAMPEMERLWNADVAQHGAAAASRPVGAGGEAARR